MKVLITGANGFVGQILAQHLLATHTATHLILVDIVAPHNPTASPHVMCTAADLTHAPTSAALLSQHAPDAVYILHGIMSSGSEADLDLGLRVNLDSVRHMLDALRTQPRRAKVVFTSSCAVYGRGAVAQTARETDVVPMPESSYGTQKLVVELLLNDYARRGLIDACALRLPTVFVRAGAPTAAASSFVSGIVREPLRGQEAVLPVDPGIGIWLASPRTLAANLVHALRVPPERWGHYRQVLLPGFTASSREILEALEKVAGRETRALVREQRDEVTQRIVESWPARYDTSRARELGFGEDVGLEQAIRDFIEGEKARGAS